MFHQISTHTLTWSVTGQLMRDYIKIGISTHTLTWSVTNFKRLDYFRLFISTHTLTWSVTVLLRGYLAPVGNFNSHAHVERDKATAGMFYRYKDFNSHAHVERDRYKIMKITGVKNFNSHAHVERDYMLDTLRISNPISTHTLTWSVTTPWVSHSTPRVFQLTRSRGA